MELDLALGVLKEGLKLWNSKEATKYLDKVIRLEKEYNDEMAKPLDERNDYVLDSVMLELRTLSRSFIVYPGKNFK